jgi:hypothetical protein
MRADGHDPDRTTTDHPVGIEALEQRRRASPLGSVLRGLRSSLASVADEAQHIMVVTDADGVVLWRDGCNGVRHRADALGFAEGAAWTETAVGTNAIGTALVERAPVQLFSAEHYQRSLHPWTCAAAPVHDPRTGALLGIVDISGPAATVHPAAVALVGMAVRLAEVDLWRQREADLEALRRGGPAPARGAGAGAVVDRDGWVAAVSAAIGTDRIAARRGRAMLVRHRQLPPEPVPGGWLLPQEAGGPTQRRIDLTCRRARGGTVWRCSPTSHADARPRYAGVEQPGPTPPPSAPRCMATTITRWRCAPRCRLRRRLGGIPLAWPYRSRRTSPCSRATRRPCGPCAPAAGRSPSSPRRSGPEHRRRRLVEVQPQHRRRRARRGAPAQ